MAGLGLADLPLPPRRFDPEGTFGFEKSHESEWWDQEERGPSLMNQSFQGGLIERRPAYRLGQRLCGTDVPVSLASSRYMRERRRAVIGALWQQHEALATHAGNTFHLIAELSNVLPEHMFGVDARLLRNALRSDINRARLQTGEPGFLIAFLHGEWNLLTKSYCLHWHGYAAGDYLSAVDSLRHRPKYRPANGDERDASKKPVVLKREPLTGLPYPLTYLMKSFWPAVWSAKGDDGITKRGTRVHRIPEPYASLALIWLDQWVLGDTNLLMGARVTREGLTRAGA